MYIVLFVSITIPLMELSVAVSLSKYILYINSLGEIAFLSHIHAYFIIHNYGISNLISLCSLFRSYMSLAFEISARTESSEMLSVMIGHGGDVNAVLPDGNSLMFAAMHQKEWKLVELLVKYGANIVTQSGHQRQTIFHVLSNTRGTLDVLKSILKRIVQISQPIIDYQYNWSDSFFQDMPYLEAEDSGGDTALLHACEAGEPENVEVLLHFGANPNTPDRWNLTPLLATLFRRTSNLNVPSCRGKVNMLKILLKHNANVHLQGCVKLGEHGPFEVMSPVELAVRTGQTLAAQILHHVAGCDVYSLTSTTIQWMDNCGNILDHQKTEIVEWLLSAQKSPIQLAARCRQMIRKHVSYPFLPNLKTFHLPALIMNYLALSDIDDFEQEVVDQLRLSHDNLNYL